MLVLLWSWLELRRAGPCLVVVEFFGRREGGKGKQGRSRGRRAACRRQGQLVLLSNHLLLSSFAMSPVGKVYTPAQKSFKTRRALAVAAFAGLEVELPAFTFGETNKSEEFLAKVRACSLFRVKGCCRAREGAPSLLFCRKTLVRQAALSWRVLRTVPSALSDNVADLLARLLLSFSFAFSLAVCRLGLRPYRLLPRLSSSQLQHVLPAMLACLFAMCSVLRRSLAGAWCSS